jgi:hypothetical protein
LKQREEALTFQQEELAQRQEEQKETSVSNDEKRYAL